LGYFWHGFTESVRFGGVPWTYALGKLLAGIVYGIVIGLVVGAAFSIGLVALIYVVVGIL